MIDVLAEVRPWSRKIELLVVERRGDKQSIGLPVQMSNLCAEGVAAEPTLTISHDAGQRLMDDLWRAGLRPSEGTGSAGALAATERHLSDMRRLTFELMDMNNDGPRPSGER